MKISLSIAYKLLRLFEGEQIPASTLKHPIVIKLLEDGVVQKQQTGKTKALLFVSNTVSMQAYLKNHFAINNLQEYINRLNEDDLTRADAVEISSNTKLRSIRTFKGFLVNTYNDINGRLNGEDFILRSVNGAFTFINDYETFEVPTTVTIVGVENPENFKYIDKQQYLFENLQPIFVSRYPQSNDLVKWLKSIPNPYLHFGDFDLAGISIYQNEYKRHLGERASYFVPADFEQLLANYGNRNLYNKQLHLSDNAKDAPELLRLTNLLHKHKKGLEQEILIKAAGL